MNKGVLFHGMAGFMVKLKVGQWSGGTCNTVRLFEITQKYPMFYFINECSKLSLQEACLSFLLTSIPLPAPAFAKQFSNLIQQNEFQSSPVILSQVYYALT